MSVEIAGIKFAHPVLAAPGPRLTALLPVIVGLTLVATGCAPRIGVVDSKRILNESVLALSYQKQLDDREKAMVADLCVNSLHFAAISKSSSINASTPRLRRKPVGGGCESCWSNRSPGSAASTSRTRFSSD
ncbi:MAG: OmpH family outer membrane protein [Bacillati bacterium ANGP1]|uniref:OmpH family outer membrane protein n=1 Tax=Candidatus Segetimicrobium genomatis TaxID=2569760 RepID=A0A537IXE0_9BACT|nr:MAG: OmpH family outer membrane protein [Terrabacteria group bacterium ANGP1]